MLISAVKSFFFGDGEMVQSVSVLSIQCQAISAARVVGSNPVGGAFKVDCFSPSTFGCIHLPEIKVYMSYVINFVFRCQQDGVKALG